MEEQGARLPHADRNPDTESPANTPSERSNSQDERVGTQHEGTFRRWVISVVSYPVAQLADASSDLYSLGYSKSHSHYQACCIGPIGSFWYPKFNRPGS